MSDELIVITKKSTIGEIFSKYPETEPVFWSVLVLDVLPVLVQRLKMSHLVLWCIYVESQQIIGELNEAIKNGAEGSEQPFYRDSFCCLLIQ